MLVLTKDFIRDHVADSRPIYQRGERLFENGAYSCKQANQEKGSFVYEVDGSYGDYTIALQLLQEQREAVAYEAEEIEDLGADEADEAAHDPVEAVGGAAQVIGDEVHKAESAHLLKPSRRKGSRQS